MNPLLNLCNLPIELLLDHLLPLLPVVDLINLTSCSKFFSVLCNDDALWKCKLSQDYNFTGQGTARTSGWKFIYKGLYKPRVFVWGESSNGRLGLPVVPKLQGGGVPYPVQIPFHSRIVSLVAGGMCFHALDSLGDVYVWGALNGTWGYAPEGFANDATPAKVPLKLSLPAPVRSISCGRLHSSFLDDNNKAWTCTNWGLPFWLSSPILSQPNSSPKQIECGWSFSSLLTKSGEVLVWRPLSGDIGEAVSEKVRSTRTKIIAANGVIPCETWKLDWSPEKLPPIPPLPEINPGGTLERSAVTEIIQIAALENHIVTLTNHGHILKFGSLDDHDGNWEYLPRFSEGKRIMELPAFSNESELFPQVMQITHITANYHSFVAYSTGSSSVVLIGDINTNSASEPSVISELQNRSIISVAIGDYHNAALTAEGKLMTWGSFSKGALGLGDPKDLPRGSPGAFSLQGHTIPAVTTPTEVKFIKNTNQTFCFAITAAGWHTGALVIDLEDSTEV